MKSVYPVLFFPETQYIQYFRRRKIILKIKLHDTLNAGLVKGIYQSPEFPVRSGSVRIGTLRRI